MNAAARLVHQGALSRHLIFTYFLTWRQTAVLLLVLSVLISALSIIYVTHVTRVMHATSQYQLIERDRLNSERNQLLLERSTLMMQARTQDIAESKLGMMMPDHHAIIVVKE